MKVLIVNDFVEKIGGAEIYDCELKKLLEKRGHQARIVGGEKTSNNIYNLFFSGWFSIKYKRLIGQEIKEFKPDIIFAHSIGYHISPSFLLEAKKASIPVVLKIPNFSQYDYPDIKISLGKPYRILTLLIALLKIGTLREMVRRYVTVFIAPSKTTANWLKDNLRVENIEEILNPVFWQVRDKIHESKGNIRRILYAGMLEEYKGIEYLIKAFSTICEELNDDNIILDIIGEGTDKNRLKELANIKNLQRRINFKGYISHEALKEEYAKADVFVLPSIIKENSPLTPLEAMSQSTPVITTNNGGQAELIKEGYNGFLVNPADSDDLAEKILNVLRNDELRKETSRNSLSYARKFSVREHVREIENLFKMVIENYYDKRKWINLKSEEIKEK